MCGCRSRSRSVGACSGCCSWLLVLGSWLFKKRLGCELGLQSSIEWWNFPPLFQVVAIRKLAGWSGARCPPLAQAHVNVRKCPNRQIVPQIYIYIHTSTGIPSPPTAHLPARTNTRTHTVTTLKLSLTLALAHAPIPHQVSPAERGGSKQSSASQLK